MKHKFWLPSAIGALMMGVLAGPASASPISSASGGKPTASDTSQTEQVRHRCYRSRGEWVCPRHGHYYRDDGPSIGLYFGDGHRRHHRRHRDW